MKISCLVLCLLLNNSFNLLLASGKKHNPQTSSSLSYRGRHQKPAVPKFNSGKAKKESDDKSAKAKSDDKKRSSNKFQNLSQKKLVVHTEPPKILSKKAQSIAKKSEQDTPTTPSTSSLSRSATLSLEALHGTSAQTVTASASTTNSAAATAASIQALSTHSSAAAAASADAATSSSAGTSTGTQATTYTSSSAMLDAITAASTQTQEAGIARLTPQQEIDYNEADGKVHWG